MFQGNNPRLSLPTWMPATSRRTSDNHHSEITAQRPQSSIAHVNLGPNSQTYIVTERILPPQSSLAGGSSVSTDTSSDQGDENPETNITINPSASNNNIHENADNDSQSEDDQVKLGFCN